MAFSSIPSLRLRAEVVVATGSRRTQGKHRHEDPWDGELERLVRETFPAKSVFSAEAELAGT